MSRPRLNDRVLRLPANTLGKDYVIGDLHGCMDELNALLNHVSFNRDVDRLLSVGDIIDRGPYSMQALELLHEPWFFSVMGNHEQMMFDAMRGLNNGSSGNYPATMWMANGGDWALGDTIDLAVLKTHYARKIDKLPYIIHVDGEGTAKFNVVHAELLGHQPMTDDNLDTAPLKEEQLLWGRKYIFDPQKHLAVLPLMQTTELSAVYCGHTPVTSPRPFLRQICIDTGCCYSYPDKFDDMNCLTMVSPSTGDSYRCYSSDLRVEQDDLRDMINNLYVQNAYQDLPE